MKIYTKQGDDGSTALFGGERVIKCDQRLRAYGTVDELNAALGMARSKGLSPRHDRILAVLQNRMFDLGAELATPDAANRGTNFLEESDVTEIETWIDSLEENLSELKSFILPGGTPAAAELHLARCICRRAEREVIALNQAASLRETILHYINRVGDLLFVLARAVNHENGVSDVVWSKKR